MTAHQLRVAHAEDGGPHDARDEHGEHVRHEERGPDLQEQDEVHAAHGHRVRGVQAAQLHEVLRNRSGSVSKSSPPPTLRPKKTNKARTPLSSPGAAGYLDEPRVQEQVVGDKPCAYDGHHLDIDGLGALLAAGDDDPLQQLRLVGQHREVLYGQASNQFNNPKDEH